MVAQAPITFRQAVAADIPQLARHHRRMFEEMRSIGGNSPGDSCCAPAAQDTSSPLPMTAAKVLTVHDFDRLEAAQKEKLQQQLGDGSTTAWLAEHGGKVVGSGCVSIIRTVPLPEDPSPVTVFLHSVYTVPALRGRGVASTILDRLIAVCKERGIHRVQLNSSEQGRGVYTRKGFRPLDRVMLLWL